MLDQCVISRNRLQTGNQQKNGHGQPSQADRRNTMLIDTHESSPSIFSQFRTPARKNTMSSHLILPGNRMTAGF